MKTKLILCLALVLNCGSRNCFGIPLAAKKNSLQHQLEQIARTNTYFSLTVIIHNRSLRLWPPMDKTNGGTNGFKFFNARTNPLAADQSRLLTELRALSGDRESLQTLLTNSDPKVRTLALGALFQREDGRDLPLIAALIPDSAPTFPNLHESMSQQGGPRPIAELVNPQTVGAVAQMMLAFWGVEHEGYSVLQAQGGRGIITSNDFADYWKKYAGRDHAASWFAVRMKRATRQITPIQPEYQPDIQRVIVNMKALPLPERAWVELYVLAPAGWYEFEAADLIATDSDLIAMIKKLNHSALLRFLRRQPVSDDPDLLLDKDKPQFVKMSNFILRHADELLRPEDADPLLACEYVQHDSGGIDPAWAIGAALVQPKRASDILHHALARETRSYETAAGTLAGALWRIRGPAEMNFLVNWFYTMLPTASEPLHQPVAFLWEVKAAARPDTKALLAALVKDSRFNNTDFDTLKEILKIVNASRATPLVETSSIYDAMPNGLLDGRMVYPVWRNLLRREYGVPQKSLPSPETKPKKHILTQPAWSAQLVMPLAPMNPSLIIPSPDGKWLAVLTDGTITIRKADRGEIWWQLPHDPTAGAFRMTFEPGGERLMVFDRAEYGRFSEWNLTTRQQIGQVLVADRPSSGLDEGAYSLEGLTLRAVFSGYNDLVCFDARSGKRLWYLPRKGGVSSLVTMSFDGMRVATGGGSENPRVVNLYDATSGKLLRQFDQFAGSVRGLTLSSEGHELATASTADGAQLWDTTTGKLLQSYAYQVPNWGMSTPILSPDGRWLAITHASINIGDNRVGVFRKASGELEWEIQVKTDGTIGGLAFSPDGNILYTGAQRLEAWSLLDKQP